MFGRHHQHGVEAALDLFGLTKEAGFGESFKNFMIGNPGQYLKDLRHGTLTSPGGSLASTLNPIRPGHPVQSALMATMQYGLPALALYQAAQAPKEQRGTAVGASLGGAVGGALGAPLGLLGSMGGSVLGDALGRTLGSNFDHRPTERTPEQENRRIH